MPRSAACRERGIFYARGEGTVGALPQTPAGNIVPCTLPSMYRFAIHGRSIGINCREAKKEVWGLESRIRCAEFSAAKIGNHKKRFVFPDMNFPD